MQRCNCRIQKACVLHLLPRPISKLSCQNCERSETLGLPSLQNTTSLLLRSLLNTRYETMFLPERLAGYNVEFSRHAARKPMVARYRRMPHGRLECLVGICVASTALLQHETFRTVYFARR